MKRAELARMIDHTNLKPNATQADIALLCEQAIEWDVYAICVNSSWVKFVSGFLKGAGRLDTKVCSVIGFPLGACSRDIKLTEALFALLDGADEIDVVMNIGWVKGGDYEAVEEELEALSLIAEDVETKLKVILETCYLTQSEIVTVCRIAKNVKVDFVKTSTGFGPKGATIGYVKLMREVVGEDMGVKAAGGISNYWTAMQMIKSGANRLGCSNTVEILKEAPN